MSAFEYFLHFLREVGLSLLQKVGEGTTLIFTSEAVVDFLRHWPALLLLLATALSGVSGLVLLLRAFFSAHAVALPFHKAHARGDGRQAQQQRNDADQLFYGFGWSLLLTILALHGGDALYLRFMESPPDSVNFILLAFAIVFVALSRLLMFAFGIFTVFGALLLLSPPRPNSRNRPSDPHGSNHEAE